MGDLLEYAKLSEKEYEELKFGANLLRQGRNHFIVHKAKNGSLRACENIKEAHLLRILRIRNLA